MKSGTTSKARRKEYTMDKFYADGGAAQGRSKKIYINMAGSGRGRGKGEHRQKVVRKILWRVRREREGGESGMRRQGRGAE